MPDPKWDEAQQFQLMSSLGYLEPEAVAENVHVKVARLETSIERLRATIARVGEICAGDHEAAYDLRADILAEIGGDV